MTHAFQAAAALRALAGRERDRGNVDRAELLDVVAGTIEHGAEIGALALLRGDLLVDEAITLPEYDDDPADPEDGFS